MDDLKRFLVELSPHFCYKDNRQVKVNVYKAFYWAITGEGKYFSELFTGSVEDHAEILGGFKWNPTEHLSKKPFFVNTGIGEYSHPKQQICGYTFKEGDAIYRCAECGYDDTCVICGHCFNKEDHVNHNVSLYYAGSGNEGMCDCGDDTAFKSQLDCACQGTLDVETNFREYIHDALHIAFDYVLDVTNFSISSLPFVHDNLENRGQRVFDTRQLSDFGALPFHKYGSVDENTYDSWYLVLWNDENHNYDEAQTAIRAATGLSISAAEKIARLINASGRAVLKEETEPRALLSSQKLAEADGLVCTIMSRRDYVREMIVGAILNWVCDIITFSSNSAFREECKKQLGILLLKPNYEFSKSLSSEMFPSSITQLADQCFRCGLVVDGVLDDMSPLSIVKSDFSLDQLIDRFVTPEKANRRHDSRLQYLLYFEIRFPLRTRKLCRKIFLALIGGEQASKAQFADQYIEAYSQLLIISALSDREEALSCMDHIRVQLLTCPRTNARVLEKKSLGRLLGPVCWLIEHFASLKNSTNGLLNIKEIVYDVRSKREKSSIEKAIGSSINDITYIFAKNDSSDILSCISSDDSFYWLLTLMKFYQGSLPITRKVGEHVSQELLKDVLIFLQRSVPIYFITKCATLADPSVGVSDVLKRFFALYNKHMGSTSLKPKSKVSVNPISLINPINAFASRLIQATPVSDLAEIISSHDLALLHLADISLKSIVLNSQVKIGLWIRNGSSVSRQASYYSEYSLKELSYFRDMQYIQAAGVYSLGEMAYSRDLHILQTALVFGNSRDVLEMIIDLWEFEDWYSGEVGSELTVYEDRFGYACEQLIKVLYHIFTDRSLFQTQQLEKGPDMFIRRICYSLCDKPKSFSDLITEFDGDDIDVGVFESHLQKCALLQSPSGITDSGVYRLRPEYYEQLDPLSSCVDLSRFESVAESLIKNLSKSRKIKENEVVLEPKFVRASCERVNEKLLSFFTTREFAKLMYKLMRESIDSGQEIYIQQLLHFLHAILVDVQSSETMKKHLDTYIDIPICDLLLTIAESSMSSAVTVKADYLLTKLIDMDDRVTKSLLDCFGESHIQHYKKRKLGEFHLSDKRKSTAERRKSKIMKKLAKQQQSFLAKNEVSETVNSHENPNIRHCVVCGEPESSKELFGILLCLTNNSTFWKVPPFEDEFTRLAFAGYDANLPREEGSIYSAGYPYKKMREKGLFKQISAMMASSCGHGIHHACFTRQQLRMPLFPCLLCHNVHHFFLPSFIMPVKLTHGETLLQGGVLENLSRLGEQNCALLAKRLLSEDYWVEDAKPLKKMIPVLFQSLDKFFTEAHSRSHDNLLSLSRLIADTIRGNEIASRVDGNCSLRNFLNQTSSQFRCTVISLLQHHAIMASQHLDKPAEPHDIAESSIFTEVIMKYLNGYGPALDYIQKGYVKLIVVLSFELMNILKSNCFNFAKNQAFYKSYDDHIEADFRSYFGSLFESFEDGIDTIHVEREKLIAFFLDSLTQIASVYLRQCSIFWDLLTAIQSENGYERSVEIRKLNVDLDKAEEESVYEVLCSFFDLPTITTLIKDLNSSSTKWQFAAQFAQNYTLAKYREDKSEGRTLMEYPGRISLIEIPSDYNACIVDPIFKTRKAQADSICLSCGKYLNSRQILSHYQECSCMSLYFTPSKNTLKMVIKIDITHLNAEIPAPYLTVHGEIKRRGVQGKASLSIMRYTHINKLWLNCGLYGFVTRLFFDGHPPPFLRPDLPTFDEIFEGDEDEFLEDFMIPSD